ncbi:MAG: glycosyltransferase [Rhodocyclaceae bacterium]|nr:glycosyltransferase [Rhodocyclaceae bacterium]
MTQKCYLNIGCGKVKLPGFVNIDLEPGADVQCDVTQGLPYEDASVDGIYSEHFIEHLSQKDIIAFLRECRRVLKPGGRVRIATPDLDEVVREYFENDWRQPWLEKYGYQWIRNRAEYLNISLREWGHQWLVNEEELSRLANLAGLANPTRCALNVSDDPRLAGLETRAESTLIMEFSKRVDTIVGDPLVSIIIPAFRADFFTACLESALAQTHRNIEILVLDDSPSDAIEKITAEYQRRDPRILYRRNTPPLGEPDNLTQGIRLARGEFIKPLYDDDLLEPNAIERLLNALRAAPDARLAAARRLPIDSSGKTLDEGGLAPPLSRHDARIRGTHVIRQILSSGDNSLGEPTAMLFRRTDALAINEPNVMSLFGYLCFGVGDICLALHLLSRGDLAYVASPLVRFRIHPGQTQRQPDFRQRALQSWAYLRYHAERLGFGPYQPSIGSAGFTTALTPLDNTPLRVTVLMLTYNQANVVEEALAGIFSQDYPIDELLVSDDASTDETWQRIVETIESLKKKPHRIAKITLRRNETNLGITRHFNLAVEASHGDLIVYNAGDDISQPDRVRKIVEDYIAAGRPKHYLVHSSVRLIGDNTREVIWRPPVIEQNLSINEMATAPALHIGASAAFTPALLSTFGPLPDNAYEDHILGFRAALCGNYRYIDEPLLLYRLGGMTSPENPINKDAHALETRARKFRSSIFKQRMADALHVGRFDLVGKIAQAYREHNLVETDLGNQIQSGTTGSGKQADRLYLDLLISHRLAAHEAQAFDAYFAKLGGAPKFDVLVWHAGEEGRLAAFLTDAARWLYDAYRLTILSPQDAPAAIQSQSRIGWRKVGAGGTAQAIWAAVRDHLEESDADWIIVLESADRLANHALLYLAELALRQPQAKLLYADEGRLDKDMQPISPLLKPDFSPDYFLACDYLGWACAMKREALLALGLEPNSPAPWRLAQLSLYQKEGESAFAHVPDVLWHRAQAHEWLGEAALSPEEAAAVLTGRSVSAGILPGSLRVEPQGRTGRVRLIVEACAEVPALQGLIERFLTRPESGWAAELVIFAPPDLPEDTFAFLSGIDGLGREDLLVFPHPEGLDALGRIAAAVEQSHADVFILLPPQSIPVEADWLERLAALASEPTHGLVAPRLVAEKDRTLIGNALIFGIEGFAVGLGGGMSFDAPGYAGRLLTPQNPLAVTPEVVAFSREAWAAAEGLKPGEGLLAGWIDFALRLHAAHRRTLWTPYLSFVLPELPRLKLAPPEEQTLAERWLPILARDPAYNVNFSRSKPFSLTERPEITKLRLPWKPLPRLLAFPADEMGCGHYRVIEPFTAARVAGIIDGHLDFVHLSPYDMAVFDADAIFLQRQTMDDQLEHLRTYRRFFKGKLIYEIDDLTTHVPVTSLHKAHIHKDIALRLRKGFELCDRLIVTTEPLKEAFAPIAPQIRVVPNYLDREKWGSLTSQRRRGAKPRVGWAGGVSHTGDLALIIDLVKATHKEVDWVFMGFCLEEIKPYVKELVPGIATPQYPAKLATLDLDLAVAPLAENAFNECKSNLRLLEFGALGWPVIASDFGPYRRSRDFPGVTLVKNRFKDWQAALREHIHDLDEAARRGDALREHIRRHWMLQDHLEEWRAAWFDF